MSVKHCLKKKTVEKSCNRQSYPSKIFWWWDGTNASAMQIQKWCKENMRYFQNQELMAWVTPWLINVDACSFSVGPSRSLVVTNHHTCNEEHLVRPGTCKAIAEYPFQPVVISWNHEAAGAPGVLPARIRKRVKAERGSSERASVPISRPICHSAGCLGNVLAAMS